MRLSADEIDLLHDLVIALGIVKTATKRLCGNDITLSTADQVSNLIISLNARFNSVKSSQYLMDVCVTLHYRFLSG